MGIAVIGMDRSGTSLAMRTLATMGVDIGPEAEHVPPHPDDNRHGYQELHDLVAINGDLLRLMEADPLDVMIGDCVDWHDSRFDDLRARATELIESRFPAEPWAIKEPRMSLVVGFWRHLWPDMKFVICVREPADVIRSQERRESNYEDRERLLRKWQRYTVEALNATWGAERLIVDFDDATSQQEVVADRYARFLGTPRAGDDEQRANLVDAELLQRQDDARQTTQIYVPPEIEATYLMVRGCSDESRLVRATGTAVRLETALIDRTGAPWQYAAMVGMYESSLSWRITAPLRAISGRIR